MKLSTAKEILDVKKIEGELVTATHSLKLKEVYEAQYENIKIIASQTGKGKTTVLADKAINTAAAGTKSVFISNENSIMELQQTFKNVIVKDSSDLENLALDVITFDDTIDSGTLIAIIKSFVAEGNEVEEVFVDVFNPEIDKPLINSLQEISALNLNVTLTIQLSREPSYQ